MTVCASRPVRSCAKSTGIDSSRRTRTGHYLIAGVFERRDGLFAPNGRELMQELFEAVPSFQVIEQRLSGNACANEHWRPAQPGWIAMHDVLWESQ